MPMKATKTPKAQATLKKRSSTAATDADDAEAGDEGRFPKKRARKTLVKKAIKATKVPQTTKATNGKKAVEEGEEETESADEVIEENKTRVKGQANDDTMDKAE